KWRAMRNEDENGYAIRIWSRRRGV
ncbi:MAG: hypothetical protein RLZZ415_854, partial [Pseudomonadota bacterium]